ncbi:TonB-dependent receptor [Tenacibaculum sp. Bg11-29]|uniref:TonB-dependent receptor n=1 Tax=Tenacibaculum sp. Bg11-29 TaxID=2058306 RepID=UPI000C336C4B|nr:TonB-dependent receptor [Tenacibaculum sp. Bg11-29]PKH49372.1 TonB-dependent receptor [Tenacibaculum sp. Bg11-29]
MKLYKIIFLALFTVFSAYSQNVLTGTIKDTHGDAIVGSSIFIKKDAKGTTTGLDGKYELKNLKKDSYLITFQSLGYKTQVKELNITTNITTLNIVLEEDKSILDEIVVSAGRTSEKISEIPASITIVGTRELEKLGTTTTNINDILEFSVPGLASSTGTYSNWGQTLRGRQLLVMVDGIPQSTPLRNAKVGLKSLNPNDISRIEVIKGATAIYGNGGDGGIVNYITKKPNKYKKISGRTNLWQTANLKRVKDALGWGVYQSFSGVLNDFSYYASGSFEQTGNKYDANGEVLLPTYGLDNTKIFSGLLKLGYQLNVDQKLSLMVNRYQTRQSSPFVPTLGSISVTNEAGDYEITPGTGISPTAANPLLGSATGVTTTNAQLKYELSDIFNGTTSLDTDLFYQKSKNIFFYSDKFVEGGQSVVNSEKMGLRPNFHTVLNINSPVNMSFTYGIDILKDKTNQGLLDGRLWVPNLDLFSYAPYLQAKFKYNQDWVFKAGVRYDAMNLKIEDFTTLPYSSKSDNNFTDPINVIGGSLDFKNTSINLGLRYIKNDEFIPYVSYSQGFSLPDLGRTLRTAKADNVNHLDINAIKTNNYEFGFLSKFKHVRFEAVGFYSTSNFGLGLVFNDDINRFEQSKNPQKIYGAEVSTDFTFLEDKLQFGGSYSFVEGLKHTPGNPNDLSYIGGDVVSPPKTTAYINIQPIKNLTSSLRLIYTGNRNRFNPKEKAGVYSYSYREVPVKGYTMLNFSSTYAIKPNVKLSVAVNNLLNEFFLPARAQWAAPLRSQTTAGEGINAKLGVVYEF